jgi:tRNA (cmo5U34)-methyltransferase
VTPTQPLAPGAHPRTVSEWDPATYAAFTASMADYSEMQAMVVEAAADRRVNRILDLGCGAGQTSKHLLSLYENACLVGVDLNERMLGAARDSLPQVRTKLVLGALEDGIPPGPFDLIGSVLAIHHVAGDVKERLFAQISDALQHGGRFILGDIVKDPNQAPRKSLRSRIGQSWRDGGLSGTASKVKGRVRDRWSLAKPESSDHPAVDQPDLLDDQLEWLASSGLTTTVIWQRGSTAIVTADKPGSSG